MSAPRFIPFTFGSPTGRLPDLTAGCDPYNSADAKPPVKTPEITLNLSEIEMRVAAALYGWSDSND